MAEVTTKRLKLEFGLESGASRTISLPDPKDNLDAAAVSTALNAMVEAGEAFADPLTSGKKGTLITTTTNVLVDNTD